MRSVGWLTLKAVAFTPWVLSRLKLALNDTRLTGSMGSLVSLLSARVSSSRFGSFEKAPSSISAMRFPVRSILLNVAGGEKNKQRKTEKARKMTFTKELTVKMTNIYPCLQSLCFLFLWFCWNVHRDILFPLAVLGWRTFLVTPPHSKPIQSGKHTAGMSASLKTSQCFFVNFAQKNVLFFPYSSYKSTNWSQRCDCAA